MAGRPARLQGNRKQEILPAQISDSWAREKLVLAILQILFWKPLGNGGPARGDDRKRVKP